MVSTYVEKIKSSLVFPSFKIFSSLDFLLGFFFTIFVITKYVSPFVSKAIIEPVVIPVTLLGLLLFSDFNPEKIQSILKEELGIVATILGTIMIMFFVLNLAKSMLLIRGIRNNDREYMVKGIQGLSTPVVTATVWGTFTFFGYYLLCAKTIGVAVIAIFLGAQVAAASVESMSDLLRITSAVKGPVIAGITFHLIVVAISYHWIGEFTQRILSFSFLDRKKNEEENVGVTTFPSIKTQTQILVDVFNRHREFTIRVRSLSSNINKFEETHVTIFSTFFGMPNRHLGSLRINDRLYKQQFGEKWVIEVVNPEGIKKLAKVAEDLTKEFDISVQFVIGGGNS